MSYSTYIKELLAPLGIYRLEGGASGGEIEAHGAGLDGMGNALDWVQREMMISTAEEEGLDLIEGLLSRKPVTSSLERRREALAALLRVGGDSFTLDAINDNLVGCGLVAQAVEGEEPLTVEVFFPDVPGVPDGFEEMREIIEDILPAHLGIEYVYWYITWILLAEKIGSWGEIQETGMSWVEMAEWVR